MNMCSVEQIIASTGFCLREEIQDLVVMKTGMTNRSYSFFAKILSQPKHISAQADTTNDRNHITFLQRKNT